MYRSTWSKPGHGRVPQAREEDLSPCSPPETVTQCYRLSAKERLSWIAKSMAFDRSWLMPAGKQPSRLRFKTETRYDVEGARGWNESKLTHSRSKYSISTFRPQAVCFCHGGASTSLHNRVMTGSLNLNHDTLLNQSRHRATVTQHIHGQVPLRSLHGTLTLPSQG